MTVEHRIIKQLPRLPLEGKIDLTYRCNNHCLHCWLWLGENAPEQKEELSIEEIRRIADEARSMGCRNWSISGGEPMLRPDFLEIFDYLTAKSINYSINTNGTLITPQIARFLTRPGRKMVAIYGATAQVHDHVTRRHGSFNEMLRGIAYLKEAGAGFIMQVIPMRDNFHQYEEMLRFAQSLSPHYRVGVSWLYLSACGSAEMNREILAQRLSPRQVVALDPPDPYEIESQNVKVQDAGCDKKVNDRRPYTQCIAFRRDFHLDPYGGASFCSFIKDPRLRYNLQRGTFKEAWEHFIPALADQDFGGEEYIANCGSCELRKNCNWCGVHGYLEHRRHGAKADYLCEIAQENQVFIDEWRRNHRRYFRFAGITLQIESDRLITDDTFHPKLKQFEISEPGDDRVFIRHNYRLPDIDRMNLKHPVYSRPPWTIYRTDTSWIYVSSSSHRGKVTVHNMAVFSHDYRHATFFRPPSDTSKNTIYPTLTFFPTDQLFLAQLLPQRKACYIHSSGVILNKCGLLFAGHSEAGKSTMVRMLQEKATILCDDRIVVRQWPDGFRIHGTWSHGDVPIVSAKDAPLSAIMFLEQSKDNRLIPMHDRKEITTRLLDFIIKPFVTKEWLQLVLELIDQMVSKCRFYRLQFDKSGKVMELLEQLVNEADPIKVPADRLHNTVGDQD